MILSHGTGDKFPGSQGVLVQKDAVALSTPTYDNVPVHCITCNWKKWPSWKLHKNSKRTSWEVLTFEKVTSFDLLNSRRVPVHELHEKCVFCRTHVAWKTKWQSYIVMIVITFVSELVMLGNVRTFMPMCKGRKARENQDSFTRRAIFLNKILN